MVNHSKVVSCSFQMKGRVLRLNQLNWEQNPKGEVYCSQGGRNEEVERVIPVADHKVVPLGQDQ